MIECYNCKSRSLNPNCHGTCQYYLEYRENKDAANRHKKLDCEFNRFMFDSYDRDRAFRKHLRDERRV